MILSSSAFRINEEIPAKYTCEGENVSPPLRIESIPAPTLSLVIVMDDPDTALDSLIHWLMYDVVPIERIREGLVPGTAGINDFSRPGYIGPCPPLGESHRYVFRVFALDITTGLAPHQKWTTVEPMLVGHVLDRAEAVCRYRRTRQSIQVPDYEGGASDSFLHWMK